MEDTIVVIKVANGFTVRPEEDVHGNSCVKNEFIYVFESYKGLFKHIQEKFGRFKPAELGEMRESNPS